MAQSSDKSAPLIPGASELSRYYDAETVEGDLGCIEARGAHAVPTRTNLFVFTRTVT